MNNYDTPSQNPPTKQNPARSSREFMKHPGYLLDTNILSELAKREPDPVVE
ncbi:MAG: hypothetical protein ACYDDT_05690 [Sulfuricella sp.]